jgi:hypothetical protein
MSTEVFTRGLILPLGDCSAYVVCPCTASAMVCVKLDTVERSPKAHFVEKVECSKRSKRCLLYCNLPVLPLEFQKGLYVRRVNHDNVAAKKKASDTCLPTAELSHGRAPREKISQIRFLR